VRLALWIERGGDRIDDRFDRAVGEREDKGADVELLEAVGSDGNDRRDDVTEERKRHASAVADAVDDQAEEHDAERERKEPGSLNRTDLPLDQIKICGPLRYQEPTHDESERRRNQ